IMQSQSELMKMGIALVTEEYGTNIVKYEFTGLNKIKPDMIEKSTKNARATAEKFAKDSESKLGKIRSASQGQFSIDNRDSNTPYIKRIRVVSTIEYYIED
ncbi:MAG: SIMPL domain-containing protein, partial [Bacteroidaceae bacterium]|nr:SIMPL domain-containing protein [Bacteroidaceae bacterium]